MNLKTTLLFAGSIVLLSACAGQPKYASKNAAADETGKICRYEKTTGSHIGTKICRTPAQMEAEREAAKQVMKRMTRGQTASSN